MQYTKIPGTDMQASRICLGTMTFGSPVAGPDAVRLVRYALEEHGVNFIDTANMYEGYNRYAGSAGGVAEEIVGEAVAHRRGDDILATKVGMKVGEAPEDENTSPEAIRIQLRRSLARMRTDYVDVYYLHRYDPDTEPHAVARAMGEELRAGTIRAWGVSNYTAAQLAALLAAAGEAVARLDDFRLQEGATLIADLLRRVDKIEGYKEEVVPYEKARTETIKARIRENLAQLDVEVDSNRLEQEMIFYLEKLDITEEKVRLQNHCRYFREVAADEETPGRKLGFIAQEMGREINTMGSKANESNIQILVVKMKDELEKIKEQVLNIL